MNWPTRIMAPAVGVVAAAAVAILMWSRHLPMLETAGAAVLAGLAVGVFFHRFGRKTNA
jgi:hypothetical protein